MIRALISVWVHDDRVLCACKEPFRSKLTRSNEQS